MERSCALLIVLNGIEIRGTESTKTPIILLIVLNGIEIKMTGKQKLLIYTFNRTKWNCTKWN